MSFPTQPIQSNHKLMLLLYNLLYKLVLFLLLHHLTDKAADDFRLIAATLDSYWKAVAFLKRQKNFSHGFSKCFHITSSDILVSWLCIQHNVNKGNNNCLVCWRQKYSAQDLNHSKVYECHLPGYIALTQLNLNITNSVRSSQIEYWIVLKAHNLK